MLKTEISLVYNKLPHITQQLAVEASKVVDRTIKQIETDAKVAIQTGPKTGRIYRGEQEVSFTTKSGKQVKFTAYAGKAGHQASAPGEAPANDTGGLAGGIDSQMTGPLSGEVNVSKEYGPALEFGSEKRHIEPRPFLGPAVDKNRESFRQGMEDAVRRSAK